MYGGVRGRKTKVGRKLLRFPPTRLYVSLDADKINRNLSVRLSAVVGRALTKTFLHMPFVGTVMLEHHCANKRKNIKNTR